MRKLDDPFAPICITPVVEKRCILRVRLSIVAAALALFYVTKRTVHHTPAGLSAVTGVRRSHEWLHALLCGTEIAEVPLSLKQRDVIRPGCRHEPQLRDVVLPEADWADIVRAGRLLKHEVTATGAGVRAHSVVSFGRSRLTTQAQRPPGRERGTWNRCASYRNVSSAKRVGG